MRRSTNVALALALAAFAAMAAPQPEQKPAAAPDTSMETGRKMFVARCATCHNERGDKPLDKGLPLNQRPLTDEVIVKNIEMRFKKASEFERRSLVAYVRSFMKSSR